MKTLFILFFISLVAIAFIIGRRLFILRREQKEIGDVEIEYNEYLFEIPNIHTLKSLAIVNTKKVGYFMAVLSIKYYMKSSNFLKKQSVLLYKKIKEKINKKSDSPIQVEKPASNFLKTVKEYKQKIDRIKHKVKREEGLK